jgi:hypothetical protein
VSHAHGLQRAAALRILSHRWKEVPDAMDILKKAIADENAQVRLWAMAVLADMHTAPAFEVALRALDLPMDESLDFLLELTAREQADIWMPLVQKGALKLTNPKHLVYALKSRGRSENERIADIIKGPYVPNSGCDNS